MLMFDDFSLWLSEENAQRTAKTYFLHAHQFLSFINNNHSSPFIIGAGVIDEYFAFFRKLYGSAYYPHLYHASKSIVCLYTYLIEKNIKVNPTWKLWLCDKKKLPVTEANIGKSEMNELVNNIFFEDDFYGRRNKVMILLWLSGMTVNEITNLNIKNARNNTAYKQKNEKMIRINDDISSAIDEYMEFRETFDTHKESPLFLNNEAWRDHLTDIGNARFSATYFGRVIASYLRGEYLYMTKGYVPKRKKKIADNYIEAPETPYNKKMIPLYFPVGAKQFV